MSVELGVSRITILDAYAQLEAEGYFASFQGAGTFVSKSLPEHLTQVRQPALTAASARPQNAVGPRPIARRALLAPSEPAPPWIAGLGAFAVHQPAFDEFPFAIWSRLVTHHARNP